MAIALYSGTKLRGDIDNYAKAILDGLVLGEMLHDDDQVVMLTTWFASDFDPDDRAEVRVEDISVSSSMNLYVFDAHSISAIAARPT